MRILDEIKDTAINRLALLLTHDEAKELKDTLEALLDGEIEGHSHVPSEDYKKEITVAIYKPSRV